MVSLLSPAPALRNSPDPLPTTQFLEFLEPRIAPAVLFAGPSEIDPDVVRDYTSTSSNPKDLVFYAASTAPVSGPGFNFSTDHYYLDLKSGDTVFVYNNGFAPDTRLIQVTGGRAFAFFFDSNGDGIPQANELAGFAVSAGARVQVSGSIDGDVLATLDSKTGVIFTDSLISNKQSIAGFSVAGDINGRIVAGGNISNISVTGNVEQINSGTPDGPYTYSFGGTGAGPGQGTGTIGLFDPGLRQAGGSISGVTVGTVDAILAGVGGISGKGGNVSNITVIGDSNDIQIRAGDGGDGAVNSIVGGLGGKVSQVVLYGPGDVTPGGLILVAGGEGGDAFPGSNGKGGTGGSADSIWVGFEYNAKGTIVESPNLLRDRVFIHAGDGGAGVTAGAGGSLSNINVLAAPDNLGPDAEIRIVAGDGGLLPVDGKRAGAGGSISNISIQNLDTAAGAGISNTLVAAGNASASNFDLAPVGGTKANGGSISGGTFIGFNFAFLAGDGSDTDRGGGAGGSIAGLEFGTRSAIILSNLNLDAGAGGSANKGAGGAGGDISAIFAPLAKINNFSINQSFASSADGGLSLVAGAGGRGGSVSDVRVFDADTTLSAIAVRSGDGGNGMKAGGAAGSISSFSYFANNASLEVIAGNGGSSIGVKGNGGAGGSINRIAFSSTTPEYVVFSPTQQNVSLMAGDGGDAAGSSKAGNGGSITLANIQTYGRIEVTAGDGGNSETKGSTGSGGSIGSTSAANGVFLAARGSIVAVAAGDAGVASSGNPARGGAGGSINNVVASAITNTNSGSPYVISMVAGNGQFGGAGGDIGRVGYYGVSAFPFPPAPGAFPPDPGNSPNGPVLIQAGVGGDSATATSAAGRGGNLNTVTGYITANTMFNAGDGGSGGRGGAGGSVSNLIMADNFLSGNYAVVAGHGGDGASKAGVGGSVSNLTVQSMAIAHAIAAGDGGDSGRGRGANGGSISGVNVAGEIGLRSGQPFGFSTDGSAMGGIFTGKAGVNTMTPDEARTTGSAGNVTDITARAISAIVAGRETAPYLANNVDGIYLRGLVAATANPDGSFSNFGGANLVGGKASNPNAPGATAFQFVGGSYAPSASTAYGWTVGTTQAVDGLIAAVNLTNNRNFAPLVLLTDIQNVRNAPPVYRVFVPPVPLAGA